MLETFKKKTLLQVLLIVFTTSAFGQFIIEESLQNFGFGVSILVMNGCYFEAKQAIEEYEDFHNDCGLVMTVLSFANPISGIWFSKYMRSDQAKIRYWKYTIAAKLKEIAWKEQKEKENQKLYKFNKEPIDGPYN